MAYPHERQPGSRLAPTAAVIALLFLVVAMGVTAARAASLGEMQVVSQLGQPFHARIEVAAASRHELDTLGARLASANAYREAGLSYAPALQSLRFELAARRGGRHYIQVRSSQPLHEPVLDLVVELASHNGTGSYAYTALIDPLGSRTAPLAVTPFAKHEPVPATARARSAERPMKPVGSTIARAASAAKRDASIARQIRQKEDQLTKYKQQLAAAHERITELQWTAQEQEQMLAGLAADAIARDMRAAAAPNIVRASHESTRAAVTVPPAGIGETPGETLYIGGAAAAVLLAALALVRLRRRSAGVISGQY